jgi:hypothetical protein
VVSAADSVVEQVSLFGLDGLESDSPARFVFWKVIPAITGGACPARTADFNSRGALALLRWARLKPCAG